MSDIDDFEQQLADSKALLAQNDYAIVDTFVIDPPEWYDSLPTELLVPHILRGDADRLPALLPLKSLDETTLGRIAQHLIDDPVPCGHLFSCLFSTRAEQEKIHNHLKKRMILHGPKGMQVLLRYYDSNVYPHMERMLRPEQMRAFFGPIETWTFRFQEEWITRTPPEVEGTLPQFWAATDKQHQRLSEIYLINTSLHHYRIRRNRPWKDFAEFEAAAVRAERALTVARNTYNMDDQDSLTLFTLHALTYGERFHLHPLIQKALREPSYTGSISDLTPTDWTAIARSPK